MSKRVIQWEPKREEKRRADGSAIPGEYTGKMRTKVPEGTPGAIRYQGSNAAGVEWDYWGLNVDSVAGYLRWIDKRDGGDYGTNLVLFLETDKFLHQVTVKYDPYSLKDVMNHLCGLGKHVATSFINVSYWVRKAQKADKSVKTDKDGNPVWARTISFRDIVPQFSYEEWRDFAQANGLEWTQIKRANGKTEWNSDAEYRYWDSRLVGIQRFLLNQGTALPFIYNSMTACEAGNPSGGGNLTSEEIEQCKQIYERIRGEYQFPYSKNFTTADDAFDQISQIEQQERIEYIEKAKPVPAPSIRANHEDINNGFEDPVHVPFPERDTTDHIVGANADEEATVFDDDDLPF